MRETSLLSQNYDTEAAQRLLSSVNDGGALSSSGVITVERATYHVKTTTVSVLSARRSGSRCFRARVAAERDEISENGR